VNFCTLTAAVLLLMLLSQTSAAASDLVISGNQVITIDSDYTQAGNIFIRDSGTLIVKNGATLTAS